MAKFLKVMEWIVKDKLLESIQIFQPTEPSYEALTLVHNRDYVDSFIKGSLPLKEMRRTGFHWSEGLVKRCSLEVGMLLCWSSVIVQFQKISILPPWKVFCFAPPGPPRKFQFSFLQYFASKILTLKTPLRPPGISYDLLWGG